MSDAAILTLDLESNNRRESANLLVTALEDPGVLYIKNVKGYQPGMLALKRGSLVDAHLNHTSQEVILMQLIKSA